MLVKQNIFSLCSLGSAAGGCGCGRKSMASNWGRPASERKSATPTQIEWGPSVEVAADALCGDALRGPCRAFKNKCTWLAKCLHQTKQNGAHKFRQWQWRRWRVGNKCLPLASGTTIGITRTTACATLTRFSYIFVFALPCCCHGP